MTPRETIEARAGQIKNIADKAPGRKLASEFIDFILRGNVVSLAVAVVIGTAFNKIVTTLTSSFITPLIAAIGGQPDFSKLSFELNKSVFTYGLFLNDLIAFLITAGVVFFLIVKPMNHLMALRKTEEPVAATTKECPECLSSIPEAATRCAFCTVVQPKAKKEETGSAGTDDTTGDHGEESVAQKAKGLFKRFRG